MNTIPVVSIILTTYNDSKFIEECINSVLSQTYKKWEFIIIDDASSDNTWNLLRKYKKDRRFIMIKNRVNKGATINLNVGIGISKGKYIAHIDGDDVWISVDKLQKQLEFLDFHPKYGLVGSFSYAVNASGRKIYEVKYPYKDREIKKILLRHNCFIHSAVLIRKDCILKVGKYNESYRYAQDYDLFLKLGLICKVYNLPKYLVNYRINPNGVSIKKYKQQLTNTQIIISNYKNRYPHYYFGFIMWSLRKYYPLWFRGATSQKIKNLLFK